MDPGPEGLFLQTITVELEDLILLCLSLVICRLGKK